MDGKGAVWRFGGAGRGRAPAQGSRGAANPDLGTAAPSVPCGERREAARNLLGSEAKRSCGVKWHRRRCRSAGKTSSNAFGSSLRRVSAPPRGLGNNSVSNDSHLLRESEKEFVVPLASLGMTNPRSYYEK